jgi:tRNA pseudouridine(38-40) synthase
MVKGQISLHQLFGIEKFAIQPHSEDLEASFNKLELLNTSENDKAGRWGRVNFKIVISYNGTSFDGWQKQPDLNTVQGIIEKSLGQFVDEKKAELLKEKGLPLEGCATVAGRTDKGVTAFQQVCAFYTWRKDVKTQEIEDSINAASVGTIRIVSVSKVSRAFHPNFSAKWRRYLYIFPLTDTEENVTECVNVNLDADAAIDADTKYSYYENIEYTNDQLEQKKKPTEFEISKVNRLLRQLEGKLLSYKIFARDTKASRSNGPPTECFLFHARATEVTLPPSAKETECTKAMCVELVGNRFLRKMVRVLVATSIREAAAGAEDDALIKLMDATCRRATAPPAPPDGLCLFDVGYTDFDPQFCLIH